MNNPTTQVPCPICNGSGRVGTKCPYPASVEVDCSECGHSCDDEACDACDGVGEMDQYERAELLETMGKIERGGR